MSEMVFEEMEIARTARNAMRINSAISRFPRFTYCLGKILAPWMIAGETEWNKNLRFGYQMSACSAYSPGEITARRHVEKDMIEYSDHILNAKYKEKPVVWSEWNLSNEILRVFDVYPYIPETLAVMSHIQGCDACVRIIEEAEAAGMPTEYCSAAKTAVGGYLLKQAPEPDVIISSSHPCDSVTSSYQTLQYLTKKPMFVVDTPYWKNEDSYNYYAQQLWDLIDFLETHLGQRMDWEKFAGVCENVNTTNHYLQEITEMARAIPAPTNVGVLLYHWMDRMACFGSEAGAVYAKTMWQIAQKRLKKGKGIIKKQKIRIVWWDVPLVFSLLYSWLEREFGAITVADFIGRIQQQHVDTTSPDTMIRDLAKTHMQVTMARQTHGPAEFYTEEFKKIIEEYSPDCFIFMGHTGCKGAHAAMRLLRDVCKNTGLPALFLSCDIFDRRNMTEEQIKREITEFFRSNGLA